MSGSSDSSRAGTASKTRPSIKHTYLLIRKEASSSSISSSNTTLIDEPIGKELRVRFSSGWDHELEEEEEREKRESCYPTNFGTEPVVTPHTSISSHAVGDIWHMAHASRAYGGDTPYEYYPYTTFIKNPIVFRSTLSEEEYERRPQPRQDQDRRRSSAASQVIYDNAYATCRNKTECDRIAQQREQQRYGNNNYKSQSGPNTRSGAATPTKRGCQCKDGANKCACALATKDNNSPPRRSKKNADACNCDPMMQGKCGCRASSPRRESNPPPPPPPPKKYEDDPAPCYCNPLTNGVCYCQDNRVNTDNDNRVNKCCRYNYENRDRDRDLNRDRDRDRDYDRGRDRDRRQEFEDTDAKYHQNTITQSNYRLENEMLKNPIVVPSRTNMNDNTVTYESNPSSCPRECPGAAINEQPRDYGYPPPNRPPERPVERPVDDCDACASRPGAERCPRHRTEPPENLAYTNGQLRNPITQRTGIEFVKVSSQKQNTSRYNDDYDTRPRRSQDRDRDRARDRDRYYEQPQYYDPPPPPPPPPPRQKQPYKKRRNSSNETLIESPVTSYRYPCAENCPSCRNARKQTENCKICNRQHRANGCAACKTAQAQTANCKLCKRCSRPNASSKAQPAASSAPPPLNPKDCVCGLCEILQSLPEGHPLAAMLNRGATGNNATIAKKKRTNPKSKGCVPCSIHKTPKRKKKPKPSGGPSCQLPFPCPCDRRTAGRCRGGKFTLPRSNSACRAIGSHHVVAKNRYKAMQYKMQNNPLPKSNQPKPAVAPVQQPPQNLPLEEDHPHCSKNVQSASCGKLPEPSQLNLDHRQPFYRGTFLRTRESEPILQGEHTGLSYDLNDSVPIPMPKMKLSQSMVVASQMNAKLASKPEKEKLKRSPRMPSSTFIVPSEWELADDKNNKKKAKKLKISEQVAAYNENECGLHNHNHRRCWSRGWIWRKFFPHGNYFNFHWRWRCTKSRFDGGSMTTA